MRSQRLFTGRMQNRRGNQVHFAEVTVQAEPCTGESQRPRAVRTSDPSIHPHDRKPATIPRGQPWGPTASPELGVVSPDPGTLWL